VTYWCRYYSSDGREIERVNRDAARQPQPVLVNCLDVSPERLEWFLDDALPDSRRILVCNGIHFRLIVSRGGPRYSAS